MPELNGTARELGAHDALIQEILDQQKEMNADIKKLISDVSSLNAKAVVWGPIGGIISGIASGFGFSKLG